MNSQQHKNLTISGKLYPEDELREYVKKQSAIKSNSTWELKFYEFVLEWISDSTIIKVKTSGSTGQSKWINAEKEKMIKSAELTGQFFNLNGNDRSLLCLPINYIAGKMMVVRAFVLGLNLIPVEPSGNPLKSLNESFDFAAMTPMQVYNILNEKDGDRKLNQIKNLIIGGGEINHAVLNRIRVLKNNTYHTYGMTETLTHVALKKLNGEKPDSYFEALPGIKFKKDKRDCLVVVASHISDRDFITNDIVDLKDEQIFRFIGRYDNVINSGGIKISQELVEQKLQPVIKKRFIVAGIPDDRLGQKVILIIEGKANPPADFMKIFTKIGLSKYETPKQVYFLDHFPETESGKIIRQQVSQVILLKNSK